ncbi:MAG TPA: ABC transporter substrate-binding protein [Anaerolineae bacterium]|nr:ABC transporter substrate-binding protein [Anaerolineae bacterium]
MKRPSLSRLILVAVLASLLLSACGGAPASSTSESPASVPVKEGSGVTVVDAMGRTVEFPQPPQRIVVAGRSSLTIIDTLFLFPEARERVIGLVIGRQNPGAFLNLVDPSFEQKEVLEVEAGPEQIAPLHPDVVIMRSFMAESLGGPVEQLDIPVVYVDLETPEQYFRDLATIGQLFGNSARAEEIEAFYQSGLGTVEDQLQDLGDEQKPRTLLLQYTEQGGEVALNVPSASWLQTAEVELAGGNPVWKDAAQGGGWTVVNFEEIAAWDPDKVFVISYGSDSAEVVDKLKSDSQWQALKAVQNGEIYGFAADTFSWDQPDPRWILGVTWLAGKLHPDRFPDLNMMQEASEFFEQMYGLDESTIQEKILSSLKGDVE